MNFSNLSGLWMEQALVIKERLESERERRGSGKELREERAFTIR